VVEVVLGRLPHSPGLLSSWRRHAVPSLARDQPAATRMKTFTICARLATYVISVKKREAHEVWGGLARLSPKLFARWEAWTPSGTAGETR
jgi:hypothetical protein